MKKIFNFILVLTLCAMPLFITGCSKTRAMHFETTYIVWNEIGDKLNCTYGM